MENTSQDNEVAIRKVIQQWLEATKRRDHERVLALTHDDLLFHVPNADLSVRPCLPKSGGLPHGVSMDGTADTAEVEVRGDLGYARTYLNLTFTSSEGTTTHRAGWALGIYRRNAEGQWQLWRDANFVKQIPA